MNERPKRRNRVRVVTHSELRLYDDWLTIYDLMDRFCRNYEWVYDNFVKAAPVPYRKRGSLYIWHKDHIDAWVKNGDDRPNATP